MSGGAYEYAMGNMVSPDGTTMMSGRITESGYHSDYTGIIHDEGNYTSYIGTYDYPEEKYYDKYSFGSKYNDNIRSKLGDGIKEIAGWNNTVNYVPRDIYPWSARGGHYDLNSNAGVFYSDNASGGWGDAVSTRFIIANKRG